MKGIDYAWGGPRGQLGTLKSLGYGFIARYLSGDSAKNLTLQEKNSAMAVGLAVVLVWETTANRILGGHAAGVADAQAADAQVKALGMGGVPIYFACDFDAGVSQQPTINAYLDGVASVIGRGRTGLYGGYYPVKRAFDAGKITYAWQTYAWSGGQWDSRAHIQQYQNGVRVLGFNVDLNRSMHTDFGQWPRQGGGLPKPESMVLRLNDSGDAVKYLQHRLNVWGAKLVEDGSFGAATDAAVKAFQTKAKLTVDGVVGPATWVALDKTPVPTPPKPPAPPPAPPPHVKVWQDWTTTGTYSLADFAKVVAGTDVASLLAATVKHYGILDAATKAYVNGLAAGTVKPTDKITGAKFWVFK